MLSAQVELSLRAAEPRVLIRPCQDCRSTSPTAHYRLRPQVYLAAANCLPQLHRVFRLSGTKQVSRLMRTHAPRTKTAFERCVQA